MRALCRDALEELGLPATPDNMLVVIRLILDVLGIEGR